MSDVTEQQIWQVASLVHVSRYLDTQRIREALMLEGSRENVTENAIQ